MSYVPQMSNKHPKGATTTTKAILHKKPRLSKSQRKRKQKCIHIWSTQISIAASKTLNCHRARTTMVNIRTLVLNDWDFRTISGQLCNFRTAGTPATYASHGKKRETGAIKL